MNSVEDSSSKPIDFYHFNSIDEMDRFKLEENLQMTDLERFRMFMTLMQIGRKLKNAPKIHKQID